MMKSTKMLPTLPLRIIAVLCGVFLLMVPRREIADWSSFQVGLYYSMAVGYIAIASIRVQKVSQSLVLTVALSCLAAVPLLITLAQVVGSVFKFDLAGTDAYTWCGLLFVLLLEMLLPLALFIEFNATRHGLTPSLRR